MLDSSFLNVILSGLGVGFTVLGWFARELWSAVKELREDLVKLKTVLSEHYVRKDDFKDFRHELLGVLQRIEQKLDNKQDK
jgi:hypothetical protein